jgi:hypothetical protein
MNTGTGDLIPDRLTISTSFLEPRGKPDSQNPAGIDWREAISLRGDFSLRPNATCALNRTACRRPQCKKLTHFVDLKTQQDHQRE